MTLAKLALGFAFRSLILGMAIAAGFAQAQSGYPARPVRMLVGFPPGGGTDLTARIVATNLAERLGQPVVVENRVGAGGNIAMDAIAKAAPDGYTIGVAGSLITINATLQPNLPFDPVKDFAPITKLVSNPLVLFSNPAFEAKDLRQLIALAKAKPGAISYGSPGAGTAMHLVGALLNQSAGMNLVHVAYKGNGPVVNDVLGGQVPLGVADVASTLSFIKSGRLHVIGVATPQRTRVAPELPTLAESGLPGFQVQSWTGVVAPARTPPEIITRLNANIRAILENAEVRDKLLAAGLEPAPNTPEEFAEVIRTETQRWAKAIRETGVKPDS